MGVLSQKLGTITCLYNTDLLDIALELMENATQACDPFVLKDTPYEFCIRWGFQLTNHPFVLFIELRVNDLSSAIELDLWTCEDTLDSQQIFFPYRKMENWTTYFLAKNENNIMIIEQIGYYVRQWGF